MILLPSDVFVVDQNGKLLLPQRCIDVYEIVLEFFEVDVSVASVVYLRELLLDVDPLYLQELQQVVSYLHYFVVLQQVHQLRILKEPRLVYIESIEHSPDVFFS